MIRPLMEKVQKKGYDAVLRKFTFPHVSDAWTGVLELLGLAVMDLPAPPGALIALPGFLPCAWVPPLPLRCVSFPGTSCQGAVEVVKLVLLVLLGLHLQAPIPRDLISLHSPAVESPAPQGIPAVPQPVVPGCGSMNDILPVFPRSDASSPAPGKPGCSSSSSPSTWSSGDLAPRRRLVSHRCSSLVSAPWQSPCCQQDFEIELS